MQAGRKPRDAAGLILLRDGAEGLEVLMGRRHAKARFMPGVYVFPGGGLDRADRTPSGLQEKFTRPHPSLDAFSREQHDPLARAALRELFEETGFLFGRPATEQPAGLKAPAWRVYARQGLRPAFEDLTLIARAITPASLPIRFHTRFFLASGAAELVPGGPGDGELEDIGWKSAAAVLGALPTPGITEKVLSEALVARGAAKSFPPVRFTARGSHLYIRQQAGFSDA